MNTKEELEIHIEQLRSKMYDASESKLNQDKVIKISQELDLYLNKLKETE
ncbi:aspartyl-phosphate phosphatase Spo0E family protein [Oceanobacillus longus]|uniref:Aspartyl-phosphate phosphatase Spo0E family protein n=1 Tax=Oceanobacillus longus TaxID=930120 RepID=A0ABV8H062_9BACI